MPAVMPPWMMRPRLALLLTGLIAAYAVAGFVWLPSFLSHQASDWVRNELQRELTLGRVQFNPFTLTLEISDLQLRERNGQPIAQIGHLLVNAELDSIFGTPHFKAIAIDAPAIHALVDAQGHLNLDLKQDTDASSEDKANTEIPALRIDSFVLREGLVHVEDHSQPQPFITDLKPIQFSLSNFRTEPQHENAFRLKAISEQQESFEWQGEFTVQPLGSKGQLRIAGLQASTLQSYLQDALPFKLLQGSLDINGNYQLTVGEQIELSLTLPRIEVKQTQIAPKNSTDNQPWVSLDKLALNDTRVSLQQRQIDIARIQIDGAQLDSWLDANYQLNLLELLGPDEPNEQPWLTQVQQIDINQASVAVADRSLTPAVQFKLAPVQMQINHFSTAANSTITLNTTLRINDAADLSLDGSIQLDTLQSKLNINLKQLPLTALQGYAHTATDVVIDRGTLQAQGKVDYKGTAKSNAPELRFTGDVAINDLATRDNLEKRPFINWQALSLHTLSYSMAPDALTVGRIVARNPYGRVTINADGTTNIQHVLRTVGTTPASDQPTRNAKATTGHAMRVRIDQVQIANGNADFTDLSVQPAFATDIQNLNGVVTGLSSVNGSRATIKLDGSVDRHAPVAISGEANFLAADTYSDLSMSFRNMELTTFNPYSGKFAGYSIAKGKLSTELHYLIQDRQLNAQHHIVVDQLEFGPATDSKDAVPLPIKLVVALLKDRNGVIDLQLPVGGSLDDPSFKLGPIVWKAVMGLFSKIATAPFAALGRLFGGGDELAYVDFATGATQLSAAELDKLGKLAKGLAERPQLKLNVPLTVLSDADMQHLNDDTYREAVNAELANFAAATPAQQLNVLTALYQRSFASAPDFSSVDTPNTDNTAARITYLHTQLKPRFLVNSADRVGFTRARAEAVQTAITAAGIAPERVYLINSPNQAKPVEGVARMALQLE